MNNRKFMKPLGLIVHGSCFLCVNVFEIKCIILILSYECLLPVLENKNQPKLLCVTDRDKYFPSK